DLPRGAPVAPGRRGCLPGDLPHPGPQGDLDPRRRVAGRLAAPDGPPGRGPGERRPIEKTTTGASLGGQGAAEARPLGRPDPLAPRGDRPAPGEISGPDRALRPRRDDP